MKMKSKLEPRIMGVVGSMGAGKTLFMSFLAYQYRMTHYIMANYDLKCRHEDLTPDKVKNMMARANKLKGSKLVLLDEVHIFNDSRSSMSKQNMVFSYFITQTRKNDIQMMYTTQHFNQVDKRLRDNTDVITFPVYNEKADILTVHFYNRHFLNGNLNYQFSKRFKNVKFIFDEYSTEQLIGINFFDKL
ncbi:MAG: ATP-binding protein [Atribacterota bacterium]